MNVIDEVMQRVELDQNDQLWRGTVTDISGVTVSVRRVDQAAADAQYYQRLDSYAPTIGDDVLVARLGHGYIVLGTWGH